MHDFLQMMLNADELIADLVTQYGAWTYWIVFAIIFIETGLVVVAIFPGDGLLFAVGIMAAAGQLELGILLPMLSVATILGNTSNFFIGKFVGSQFFIKKIPGFGHYLEKTHSFYHKYGSWTVVLSRFFPFMRTLVPFAAGLSNMNFSLFTGYNIVGGVIWILSYVLAGYLVGEIPLVKQNYGLVFFIMTLLLVAGMFYGLIVPLIKKKK